MTSLTESDAAKALGALGNPTRLRLCKSLVRAGGDGLNIGQLQKRLRVPASTLAHHISTLVQAGLVHQERQGREVISRARFTTIREISAYLLAECCAESDCRSTKDAA